MSKPRELTAPDYKAIGIHAAWMSLSAILAIIATYVIPSLSGGGPWGIAIAAVLSIVLKILRQWIPQTDG